MLETALTLAIIGVAVWYLFRTLMQQKGGSCGCGGSCACGSSAHENGCCGGANHAPDKEDLRPLEPLRPGPESDAGKGD